MLSVNLPAQIGPLHMPVVVVCPTPHVNCTTAPFLVKPALHVTFAVPPKVVLVGVPSTALLRDGTTPQGTPVNNDI